MNRTLCPAEEAEETLQDLERNILSCTGNDCRKGIESAVCQKKVALLYGLNAGFNVGGKIGTGIHYGILGGSSFES